MDNKRIRETVAETKDFLRELKDKIDQKEAETRNLKEYFCVLAILLEQVENILASNK